MLVMQLGPNDGPTSVGPPYRGAIRNRDCPALSNRPLATERSAPVPNPVSRRACIERPFFAAPWGGATRLAGGQWLDMRSITLVLLVGHYPALVSWGHSGLRREVAMGISPQRCHVADLVGSCGGFGFVCVPTDGSARIDFDGCRTGKYAGAASAIR
jgi:hypothetical protein